MIVVLVILAIATGLSAVLSARDTLDEIWWYNQGSVISILGNLACTVAMATCAIGSAVLVVTW